MERDDLAARQKLRGLVLDDAASRKTRLHALWSLVGAGHLDAEFHQQLLKHADPGFRAWGVRAAGNFGSVAPEIAASITEMASDDSADVKLQVAITATKIPDIDTMPVLLNVLANSNGDMLIPHIVWQNLHPRLEQENERFVELLAERNLKQDGQIAALVPRIIDRVLAIPDSGAASAAGICRRLMADDANPNLIANVLSKLRYHLLRGELSASGLQSVQAVLDPVFQPILSGETVCPLSASCSLTRSRWREFQRDRENAAAACGSYCSDTTACRGIARAGWTK